MNKQFDIFIKMKAKELSDNISKMTYAYVNPETKLPTVVPASHYRSILDEPVEAMVNDQVKKQFLNIMFKQMKSLREEEPSLFMETLLLMDINKTPDSLSLNEEVALKLTAEKMLTDEKELKKNFHMLGQDYLSKYESSRDNQELMADVISVSKNDERLYKIDIEEPEFKIRKKDKGFER